MRNFIRSFCVTIGMLGALASVAQERVVRGKVSSPEDNSPIPGVNILVKGTGAGTSTDSDGNYSLSVAGDNAVLTFSFIGYVTQEIVVGTRTVVDVQLAMDVKQLSEVVVVGYGTQIKQELTGNIASVKGQDIQNLPVQSFEQAIQGRAAGVFVEAGTGKLGQGIKVRVRGASSVSAGNQPLYVIDGIPVTSDDQASVDGATNPLADLNPNDIESIEILKDASAASIYGSRAANGVMLITTKRGKSGQTNFNIGYQTGFSKETNRVDFLNTKQYVELITDATTGDLTNALIRRLNNYGADPLALTNPTTNNTPHASWITPGAPGYVNTDWQDQIFQKGNFNQLDFSASGGVDKTKFFTSLSWSDQNGIIIGNKLNRISGRINLDHQVSDRLSIGVNFSLARTNNFRIADDNAFSTPLQMVALTPMTPVIDPRTGLLSGALNPVTGEPNSSYPLYYNPLLSHKYGNNKTTVFRNFGTLFGTFKIVDGLSFRSEFGYDLLTQREEYYFGQETANVTGAPDGAATDSWTQVFNYTTNNFLQFNKMLAQTLSLEAVAGMSFQQSQRGFSDIQGQDFPSNSYKLLNAAATISVGNVTASEFTFLSYFARANLKLSDRYLLGLSGRIDGSSRFGSGNQYGFFPAVSAGWIITEESFLKDNNVVEFLKLRASYGLTGNAEIANFPSLGLFSGGVYGGIAGQGPTQLENPDLKWEQTAQLDIGIDFGIFNNRISGEIDYYIKKTSDLLLNVNLESASGFTTQTRNVGEMENKGVEVVLNSNNLVGDLKWNTSFNFAANRNKIVNLQDQIIEGSFLSRAVEGEPIGIYYGPKFAGVDPDNGNALYYTRDVNGELITTTNYNAAEYMKIGDPNPDFIAGITNTLSYKGVDLSILFQGVFGNQVYNGAGKFMSANGGEYDNQTVDQLKRWRNPGDKTNVPRASTANVGTGESSRYVYDAGYVRLKTVTLGYTLPQSVISKAKLTKARVYVSAQNLLTFTDYKGWDPEVNADTYASNINQGIDFYSAPQAKTITFGVSLGF